MELTFLIIGLTLQLVGAYITYRGFRRGWDEVSGSDRFIGPLLSRIDRLNAFVRRKLGIKGKSQTIYVRGVADSAVVAESATVLKQLGPLDDLEPDEAIKRLYTFVNETAQDVNRGAANINENYRQLSDAIRHSTQDIDQRITQAAEQSRKRSITGLRIEASGFLLLTVGAVIQGIGTFFGL